MTDLFLWPFILLFTNLQKHFDRLDSEKKLFVREFKRDSVIALYLTEKPQLAIVKALQHLNVKKSLVTRTIARYCDTGSVVSRQKSGRKKNNNNTTNYLKNEGQIWSKSTPQW